MRAAVLCAALALLTALVTGCTTTEQVTLPTGATLLGSDDGSCDGPIQIEGNPDVTVDEGQTTTLAFDDDEDHDWSCLSDSSSDQGGDIDCPDGTDYIRITREEDEDDFRLECFGG